MKNSDNVSIEKISLLDSGLLSKNNKDLLDFISDNKSNTVSEFIDMMDNNTFTKVNYTDVLIEARGLADLLKLKYLYESLIIDVYLASPIKEVTYEIYGDYHTLLSLYISSDEKVNIYSAITRLGFNDKERLIILGRDSEELKDRMFFDVLYDVYNEVLSKNSVKEDDMVFINKLSLIIEYYKKEHKLDDSIRTKELIEKKMTRLSDLLERREKIEQEIISLRNSINQLETSYRSINR